MGRVVLTQVEELPENKVRLSVEVPPGDVRHAVDHAASDLAASLRIPGFRKGKVPMPVLMARLGKQRVYAEAVESHIGGWFRSAARTSRIRPVAQPEYAYDLPPSADAEFRFTATVAVQPMPEVADWTTLEVPAGEPEVPEELVQNELEVLRHAVAELVPVEGRPAREGDVVVVDLVGDGERRDYVVEVGDPRFIEEVNEALVGMSAGDTKTVRYEEEDASAEIEVTVKEIKERSLPPLDDELARAASEFDTLGGLRADIEARLREQLEEELEAEFRAEAADRLVQASRIEASGPLVDARARELLEGMARSLQRRGVSVETYLAVTNQTPEQLIEHLRAEAARAVARELALEAVADRLGIEISDEALRAFIREQAEAAGEDAVEETVERVWQGPVREQLREDLRLRAALDRVAADVKRIPIDLARAREKLWTPEKGAAPSETKLWTPASKERP